MASAYGNTGTGDPSLAWRAVPSSGAVTLYCKSNAPVSSWVLTRYVSGVGGLTNPVVLVSGTQSAIFIDIGDAGVNETGLPGNIPLRVDLTYVYQFSTIAGTATSDSISVSGAIVLEPDHITPIILRVMESGINAMLLPEGWKPASVRHSMPAANQTKLPFILINLDLLQQRQIPIGQQVDTDDTYNFYNAASMALRRYVIYLYTMTVEERNFYLDAIIGIFHGILGPILESIGANVEHSYQAVTGQTEARNMQPGLFYAEIALQFTGLYNIGISTDFGIVEHITSTVSGAAGSVTPGKIEAIPVLATPFNEALTA